MSTFLFFGADTGIRTRDLVLTKDVLYLLSHISIDMLSILSVIGPAGPRPTCRDYKSRPLWLQKQHCCFCLTRRAKDVLYLLSHISKNRFLHYIKSKPPDTIGIITQNEIFGKRFYYVF